VAYLTRTRALAGALALAGVAAFLPASWMAPWSDDVALVATAPLRPVIAALAHAREWLRPSHDPSAGLSPDAARLTQERDVLQGELDRERIRAALLEKQLRDIRAVVDADARGGWKPVLATVVERPAGRRTRYGLNRGAGHGVQEGDPVVVGGNQLVGRVVDPVDASHAWMIAVDDRVLGRIDALVQIRRSEGAAREPTMLQLIPLGGGRLRGEMDRAASVKAGDVVLLNDATWKPAAQGMRIGVVDRVGTLDSNPLRTAVEVRMDVEPARVGPVTIKAADPAATRDGGRP
jgi:cell shape-determining protein MreC